jgi:hypothetical protein
MSRDLPYFKFFTGEWLNGDIVLEDYELQGIFVNLCAFYWHRDCDLTIDQACKKLRVVESKIWDLAGAGVLEIDENMVCIRFLDEQKDEFFVRKKKLSDAGKKGAGIKAMMKEETALQPPLNHPSTIREEKRIEEVREENIIEDISTKVESINFLGLLEYFNSVYDKKCTVVPDNAKRSFNARIKEGYTKDNIRYAMDNVKLDDFHKENDFKYATISYFSRSKTLDTYGQKNEVQPKKYVPR